MDSILRVKDSNGNIIDIPALKGDKGDPYILTDNDKSDIVKAIIEELPENSGGKDGVSPTVDVVEIEGGHKITITDAEGFEIFDVLNGKSGVYIGSDEMPEGYNIQIDPEGEPTIIPTKISELINDTGFITKSDLPTNDDSSGGEGGKDGFSPVIDITEITGGYRITITDINGTKSFDILNGVDGKDGNNGAPVTHEWDGTVLTIVSASGTSSVNLKGETGNEGRTPQKGVDYFTEADITEIKESIIDNILTDLPKWSGGVY